MKLEHIIFGIGMFVTSLGFGQKHESPVKVCVDSLCELNKEYSEKIIKIGKHILEQNSQVFPIIINGINYYFQYDRLNNPIPYQSILINTTLDGKFDVVISFPETIKEKDYFCVYIIPKDEKKSRGISLKDFGFDGNVDVIRIPKHYSIYEKPVKFKDLTKTQKEDIQNIYEKFIDLAYDYYFKK